MRHSSNLAPTCALDRGGRGLRERRRGTAVFFGVRLSALVVVALLAGLADAGPRRARTLRFATENGPVRVWMPRGYDPATAGIVIYVHGYYTTVDRAWRQHRLARQFAASGLNALFIACEAPTGPEDRVAWESSADLLARVAENVDRPLPDGKVIAVGHSGAHRTLWTWLDDERLDTIALIDAMYGEPEPLLAWIGEDEQRRLIDVARLAQPEANALHAELPETVVFDGFPSRRRGRLPGARDARIVYVPTSIDHMPLVTGGLALPMTLRALRLPMVRGVSIRTPIRVR